MTKQEAIAKIKQLMQASSIEDWEECFEDVFTRLCEVARGEHNASREESIEAFDIASAFADESLLAQGRELLNENEAQLSSAMLNPARHENPEVRKAALKALEHVRRLESEK